LATCNCLDYNSDIGHFDLPQSHYCKQHQWASHLTPSNTVLFTLAGVISLSFLALLIFLGNLFSGAQRTNWLRQLPFRASSLNLFPLLVTFGYGLCLLIFIPWGAFSSGVSAFAIGIPIAVFLVLKNSRNFLIGLFVSSATGVALIAMWIYLFYDWSALQPQYKVELAALLTFSGIWQVLGRKERLYTLPISTLLLILLMSLGLYRQNRTPENFVEATLDHTFFPTTKSWTWFKKIALEKNYWDSMEQYNLPSYVRYRAQDFSEGLNDDEKIQFIENIEFNRVKWKDANLPVNRPMRFASFLQPEIRFSNYSVFPIGRYNVTEKVEKYLYAHWRDSNLFCQILPTRKTNEYLDKVFNVEHCFGQLFRREVWTYYSLFEHGDFETTFDKYLLEAYDKSPSKIKTNLMWFLSAGWELPAEKYKEKHQVIFNQKPLTTEMLEQIKMDRFRVSLVKLKKVSHDRSTFLKDVSSYSVNDTDPKIPLLFLAQYLLGDPDSFLNEKKSETVSLLEAWNRRAHDLNLSDLGIWAYWWEGEIARSENWPKLEKLFKYIEQREDL